MPKRSVSIVIVLFLVLVLEPQSPRTIEMTRKRTIARPRDGSEQKAPPTGLTTNATTQYFTLQPYAFEVALATGRPAFRSVNAAFT